MANKIVYLMGAGASKNALPIVSEIPDRLKDLFETLQAPQFLLGEVPLPIAGSQKTLREYQRDMVSDLHWLYEVSRRHASIDTFAKKTILKK